MLATLHVLRLIPPLGTGTNQSQWQTMMYNCYAAVCPTLKTLGIIADVHHGLPLRLIGASTRGQNDVDSVVADEAQLVQGRSICPSMMID